MLGSIMAGTECTQGRYPLTLSVLTLLTEMVQPFSKAGVEQELQACVLQVLKGVFPLFRKWRYTDLAQRKQIGQQCLMLFHKILNLANLQDKKNPVAKVTRPNLHEVCVYSLLFTEAGRALIEIVATGVDIVETALVQQGSMTEGGGVDLIELIQLSLSVLNRLLLLRSPDLPTSPVEQALSWQPAGRQSQHVVATVAQYIYHRHNPRLPTLATLLLKRLALMSPMSILACLGNDAEPIRDMYLTRLQAVSEDLRLKVAILELLSVCVETQPGLIEIFFNVQVGTSDSTAGKKDLQLGRSSCLNTLLTLMDVKKQNTYHCPPDLLRAGLDLVHSLWRGRRETAMQVLRSKQSFWASVTEPLKRDITKPDEELAVQLQPTEVKIASFAFRILAQEIYAVDGSSVDPQLKTCLQEIGKASRMSYWSQGHFGGYPLVTEDLQITDKLKQGIMAHLLEGTLSLLKMKLAAIVSALYYTLLKSWISTRQLPAPGQLAQTQQEAAKNGAGVKKADDSAESKLMVSGGPATNSVTGHGLYCLSINLYTLMLRKLGFSFLEDALNFLGAHQDRLQQSLELARLSLLEAAMLEAECTCHFLHQMALYRRQWRLHLPQVMVKLLTSTDDVDQPSTQLLTTENRSLLLFVMENCLTLAMTQAVRYLREPSLPQRDKQFLKRELGTELV
nr:hypothetical protein BaRGS_027403 [Batillaria attramentaria]